VKVVIGLALIGLLLGLGVHYGRAGLGSATHHLLDISLPHEVEMHPWAPVVLGHVRRSQKVVFEGGRVETVKCHADLGSYRLTVLHTFTFQPSQTRIKPSCPGAALRRTLGKASRADLSSDGSRLTLAGGQAGTVLVLRGRGD
jgi:hypothetical protein